MSTTGFDPALVIDSTQVRVVGNVVGSAFRVVRIGADGALDEGAGGAGPFEPHGPSDVQVADGAEGLALAEQRQPVDACGHLDRVHTCQGVGLLDRGAQGTLAGSGGTGTPVTPSCVHGVDRGIDVEGCGCGRKGGGRSARVAANAARWRLTRRRNTDDGARSFEETVLIGVAFLCGCRESVHRWLLLLAE